MSILGSMNAVRVLSLALVALALGGPIAAQGGCPFERVKIVPASWTVGPAVECSGGIDMQIGGVQVKVNRKGCPLFVIITPTHEEPEASSTPTRVVQVGTVPEMTAFFKCHTSYFLFIQIGSACELDQVVNTGQLPRLQTEACVIAAVS